MVTIVIVYTILQGEKLCTLQYYYSIEMNKIFKKINEFIKILKMIFSTIKTTNCCIVKINKKQRKKNLKTQILWLKRCFYAIASRKIHP